LETIHRASSIVCDPLIRFAVGQLVTGQLKRNCLRFYNSAIASKVANGSLGSALTCVAPGGYYGHMKKASVSDLKNQISRYLDYVKHGETVLVLDRSVPVAELKPVTGKSSSGKLLALERKGIIRLGSGKISEKFFKEKLSGKRAKILDALLEEREKGR
jgi:antitoxin (DNA-binding transcriptional repressor) of toxin-antitoxin stability system